MTFFQSLIKQIGAFFRASDRALGFPAAASAPKTLARTTPTFETEVPLGAQATSDQTTDIHERVIIALNEPLAVAAPAATENKTISAPATPPAKNSSTAKTVSPSPKVTSANTPSAIPHPAAQPGYLEEIDQARRLLAIAISRQATQFVAGATTTTIKFTEGQLKDGIKNKIVGKEGRNAKHFEEKAGVDLILNQQSDAVLISSFDPFRREIARVALETLVRDGRVQPAKIEEALAQAKTQVDAQTREAASRAAKELGINDLHPAVLRVLGTLRYRTSFGQNQLEHSVETAWLCGSLASELGFDVQLARRAGLLHDLGKALDQTRDGGHSFSGGEFARKYGESMPIVQAIEAHHEETPPESWLDHLVIAADALSGARPGARNGSTQNLLERSSQMEKIANEFPGVSESYAVQAGRELRVFVDYQKVDDEGSRDIARQIAKRIQEEVRFPGQIKVTVLRELRAIEVVTR